MRRERLSRVTRHTRPRLGSRESLSWAQVGYPPLPKKTLQSTNETSQATGHASAAWTSVGIILSRRLRSFGTAVVTWCTWLGRIGYAATLRAWGKELPWAWPRDGNRETLEGAGVALAQQYKQQGLNMLHEYSHYVEPTGQKSVSVEAGLMDMLTRMQTGRFKVFRHLNDWWEEFRLYHRKDGKVVKEGDDLMAATRYAIMMLRFASTKATYDSFRRPLVYPKVGIA